MRVVRAVGGLGSQMMAYALCLSMRKRGLTTFCDFSSFSHSTIHNGPELNRIFGISESNLWPIEEFFSSQLFPLRIIRAAGRVARVLDYIDAAQRNYNFDPRVFSDKIPFVFLHQCWTSWKYFEGCEEEIRNTFVFPEIRDFKNLEALGFAHEQGTVALHVRRGDYLNSTFAQGLCGPEYFRRSIEEMRSRVKKPRFMVFSDDLQWCRDHLGLNDALFVDWNTREESFRDMQLMSHCNHHIIPHSSFSWWGAWLNPSKSKIVIAPERWSNPQSGVELLDMNMPGWVTLPNFEP